MKIGKLYKINFLAFIFLISFYNLSNFILKLNDLAFRKTVAYGFKVIIIVLFISILIQTISLLQKKIVIDISLSKLITL